MYLEHFGLTVSPFGIMPRLDFLYRSGAFEESMAHLVYGLDNSEAVVMITGAIGTGKTMAIQSFLAQLGDRFLTALVTNTCVDGKELLKLILDDLGAPADPGADKSDLLIAFRNFIIEAGGRGQRVIIVIDEAQNLGREVLEEVRQLTNLGQGDRQPVQIILVGQPELEATVERADLAQLKQRIRVHYKLAPLSRREMEEYVDHRMVVAGAKAGIFSGGALDRIYARAGGVPRVVNTLCNDALLSAFVAGRRTVEAKDVEAPLVGDAPPAMTTATVERAAATVAARATAPAASAAPAPAPAAAPAPPVAPAPAPAMATRREEPAAPAPRSRAPRDRGDDLPPRRSPVGWLVALLVVIAALVVLGATGRLAPLWGRLPFIRHGEATTGSADLHAGRETSPSTPAPSTPAPLSPATGAPAGDPSAGNPADGPAATTATGTAPTNPPASEVATPGARPAGTQPTIAEPATAQPATAQPASAKPAPTQAAATQPATAQPAATMPAATMPATARPVETGQPGGSDRPAGSDKPTGTPGPAASPAAPAAPATGPFYVHISSFRAADHAESVAQRFTADGVAAMVRGKVVRDAQWFRVYLGPFATREEAERSAGQLRDQGKITYYKVIPPGSDEGL